MKLRYNLQFFAEGDNGNNDAGNNTGNDDANVNNNDNSNDNGNKNEEIDAAAFADLISEKDKQIQQLEKDISELKKSNAMLTVRVNAGQKPQEFNTEKAILEFCDTRKLSK